jgi:hypothetical protein
MSNQELRPAIRHAIENAISQTAAGPCQVCGKLPAKPYAFASAQQLASTSGLAHGGGTVTTTMYGPIEARGVNVCDSCVEAYKRPRLAGQRLPMIGVAAAAVVLVAAGVLLPGWREILLGLGGFAGLMLLVMSIKNRELSKSPRLAGSLVALSLYENDLKDRQLSYWPDLEMYR